MVIDREVSPTRASRALLVGVQTPEMPAGEGAELLEELKELVGNLGLEIARTELVRLRERNARYLIGSGKAAELMELAKEDNIDLIVFDEELSPAQGRNWEEESDRAVIDRQEVILEVFNQRAQTREAKLQVELAQLEYALPRLKRAWTHLSRQRGKGAMGGEGETQLEVDRRLVRNRITALRQELAAVVKQRAVQRHRRQRVPVPNAAIVGYTNAGKSCLLNRLTGAAVLVQDKLFATLDPTTRQLVLPDGRKLLVTDTVGFIRRLPHRLVEAFKATLEETIVADFLIHVLDLTNPHVEKHLEATLAVLGELGADTKRTITVFNKVDAARPETVELARARHPDAVFLSALTGAGVDRLLARCSELTSTAEFPAVLRIPHDRYDVVAKLHATGGVVEERAEDDAYYIQGRVPFSLRDVVAPFLVE
ncbi:MAG TPA: GTPase HflX [Opitutaceae bacterium]|nr:GTPase HflX [Opitutaceae bacterium]